MRIRRRRLRSVVELRVQPWIEPNELIEPDEFYPDEFSGVADEFVHDPSSDVLAHAPCGRRHYFCAECIRGTLTATLETGQFPARCPSCRAEDVDPAKQRCRASEREVAAAAGGADLAGEIDVESLSYLNARGVISRELLFRFSRAARQFAVARPVAADKPAGDEESGDGGGGGGGGSGVGGVNGVQEGGQAPNATATDGGIAPAAGASAAAATPIGDGGSGGDDEAGAFGAAAASPSSFGAAPAPPFGAGVAASVPFGAMLGAADNPFAEAPTQGFGAAAATPFGCSPWGGRAAPGAPDPCADDTPEPVTAPSELARGRKPNLPFNQRYQITDELESQILLAGDPRQMMSFRYHAISRMPEFERLSFEELRFQHYSEGGYDGGEPLRPHSVHALSTRPMHSSHSAACALCALQVSRAPTRTRRRKRSRRASLARRRVANS